MSWPSAIGGRATSIGAPAAILEGAGFIWETNGQTVATPPTAAAAPVATNRKSRRVGCSAEDAVVTITNPFQAAAGGTAPGIAQTDQGRLPAPASPAATERPLFLTQWGGTSSPESFYWHPCRNSASPLSAGSRAMHSFRPER